MQPEQPEAVAIDGVFDALDLARQLGRLVARPGPG
jgi:hypothetical protein